MLAHETMGQPFLNKAPQGHSASCILVAEMEQKPLEIGGRRFARIRDVPDPTREKPSVGFIVLSLGLIMLGNAMEGAARGRHGTERPAFIVGGFVLILLLVVVHLVYIRRRGKRGSAIGPGILPNKPEGNWQFVKARVAIHEKVGFSDLGWLKVSANSVEFRGRRCDFNTTESDWDWVKQIQGSPTIRFAKVGKVGEYRVAFTVFVVREGRAIVDREATNKLLSALQKVYSSGQPSILPPIELPMVPRPSPKKVVLAGLAGAGTGLIIAGPGLLLRPMPKKPDAMNDMAFVSIVSLMMGLVACLFVASPALTANSRRREIEKLQRGAGKR